MGRRRGAYDLMLPCSFLQTPLNVDCLETVERRRRLKKPASTLVLEITAAHPERAKFSANPSFFDTLAPFTGCHTRAAEPAADGGA